LLFMADISTTRRGRPRAFDRDAALRRAMEVFWSKGFAGASLNDLTTAMGINAPSLYAAFGTKEELFEAAVDLYAATEGPILWGHLAQAPSAKEAVRRLLDASAMSYTDPKNPPGCLVVLGAIVGGDPGESVVASLAARRAEGLEMLTERIEQDVRAGLLPEGLDARAVASFYFTVQQGMSLQARDNPNRAAVRATGDAAMLAWDGLIAASVTRR
jgi:AcrR family transcriptional regulator